ncbi:MAG: tetraacyldisaccharide 4'-kinase [Deltaproteobacteria bacterium]|nr:tetraacyldisaccharide 4'-kinase [Deltaproteobacteria bacterium]
MSLYFWLKDLLSRPSSSLSARAALWPAAGLAWLYGRALAARRWAYERRLVGRYRAPVPVISVGNLASGGTGKTPCVDTVCRILLEGGYRPAVLSRGYGGTYRGSWAAVSEGGPPLLTVEEAGDEPVLLARSLPTVPVLIGKNRSVAARAAVERYAAQVLVLDDAFQHLRMERDLDLVTMDAKYPLGNGHCLPRGLLRETPGALRSVDLVLLTRAERLPPEALEHSRGEVRAHTPRAPILAATHAPVHVTDVNRGTRESLERLVGRKVLAFAGIGWPAAFFAELENLGARVLEAVPFPDHHPYSRDDLEKLAHWAKLMNAEAVVTTDKDAVRLSDRLPLDAPLFSLGIELVLLEGEALFREAVLGVARCGAGPAVRALLRPPLSFPGSIS